MSMDIGKSVCFKSSAIISNRLYLLPVNVHGSVYNMVSRGTRNTIRQLTFSVASSIYKNNETF